MTADDIADMQQSFSVSTGANNLPIENENWIKAFKDYNSSNIRKLSNRCLPCYAKVFEFIKKKYP